MRGSAPSFLLSILGTDIMDPDRLCLYAAAANRAGRASLPFFARQSEAWGNMPDLADDTLRRGTGAASRQAAPHPAHPAVPINNCTRLPDFLYRKMFMLSVVVPRTKEIPFAEVFASIVVLRLRAFPNSVNDGLQVLLRNDLVRQIAHKIAELSILLLSPANSSSRDRRSCSAVIFPSVCLSVIRRYSFQAGRLICGDFIVPRSESVSKASRSGRKP